MPTINTVVSVAISIATHIRPILFASSAEIHREHQRLVHRVVESHIGRRQFSCLDFVANVARTEGARRETDESREYDEDDVQIVDEKVIPRNWSIEEERRRRRGKLRPTQQS